MEIDGRKVEFDKDYLSPVTYVPGHAHGNAGHEDCEQGVLIGFIDKDTARVLYCNSRTVQATSPADLVWG